MHKKPIQPFEYTLPNELIAQRPPAVRGASSLLVLDRASGDMQDRRYRDLPDYVRPQDVVVLNETKVIPARLHAVTQSGARRELFLTERHHGPMLSHVGRAIYRGKLRAGDVLRVGKESIEIIEILEDGEARIRATLPLVVLAERAGATPLPPYIKRTADKADAERYQTVFARREGSVAAPTASLNLTNEIMNEIKDRGAQIVKLTLHVGRGTFMPIRTDSLEQHVMHREYYSMPVSTLRAIRQARKCGGRVIAVGTTVTRALEHAAASILANEDTSIRDEADTFIYPGYRFQLVDMLLTNFHAPDSTVLQLAAAFAGPQFLKRAYDHALASDYRFLSYGDSMLIL
ncbi:tRNA preQ1(34) S-adenosylmethionine ribosyltransferase-isomerase QueA [bacterium]|nr:tRNA preQ1(34) S-adenosylmethionine ribosyltransferase-isomerase QueA [bacterium]